MSVKPEEKYRFLVDTINTYKEENSKLTETGLLSTRINDYKKEDSAFAVLMYKIMLVAYALMYLVFIWALISYREKVGIPLAILLAIVFALYPFTMDFVANFMYNKFTELIHYFDKGNAMFLYKPPDKTPTY